MSDHRTGDEYRTDQLIETLVEIAEALCGIRAAMHPCEYVHEHETYEEDCELPSDRMIDDCYYCEDHARKVEYAGSKKKGKTLKDAET